MTTDPIRAALSREPAGLPARLLGTASVAWPAEGALPGLPGFIESRFNPLVKTVSDRCLAGAAPDGLGVSGDHTAVVLVTGFGDVTTTDLASRRLAAGQANNPLLFYQSVPTSVLGVVTRDHRIRGPVTCLSVEDSRSAAAAFETVGLLLAEEGVHRLLLIGVELAASPRTRAALAARGSSPGPEAGGDAAVALLLGRYGSSPGTADVSIDLMAQEYHSAEAAAEDDPLHGVGALAAAARRVLDGAPTAVGVITPGGPGLRLHRSGR
ncbi:ketosynthase [Streptomyces otsuchiensis]|uniref:ketosynthase n=1 Tax=Streptomyces otsuchiensis TaxID=2681388 RepID=UPI00102F867B|nr:ketosynthase [Streptomyces otsuchiensis]